MLSRLSNPLSSNQITPNLYVRYLRILRELAAMNPPRIKQSQKLVVVAELAGEYAKTTPAEIDI